MSDFDNPFDTYSTEDDLLVKELTKKCRTKKVQLVLFGGKAGAGKTTAASWVQRRLEVYSGTGLISEVRGFATPVKEIAASCFKWDGVKDDRGRRLLQVIGTDAGRAYNPNLWVEYMNEYITGTLFIPHIMLVDDWRFPNEKEYFLNNFMYEVTAVRINRDFHILNKPTLSEHPSENSLPDDVEYYDFDIDNNGTLEELYKELDSIVSYLSTKIISY